MILETRIGPSSSADGNVGPVRSAKTGEMNTVDAHGRYHEMVVRGNCFYASSGSTVATIASGASATVATLSLYNPIQSRVNLALIEATFGYGGGLESQTTNATNLFTAFIAVNFNPFAAAPTTTTLAPARNCLLGGSSGVGVAFIAGTLPATPTAIRTVAGFEYFLGLAGTATGVAKAVYAGVDNIDSKLVLAPNSIATIQGDVVDINFAVQAGANVTGIMSLMWEEVPI